MDKPILNKVDLYRQVKSSPKKTKKHQKSANSAQAQSCNLQVENQQQQPVKKDQAGQQQAVVHRSGIVSKEALQLLEFMAFAAHMEDNPVTGFYLEDAFEQIWQEEAGCTYKQLKRKDAIWYQHKCRYLLNELSGVSVIISKEWPTYISFPLMAAHSCIEERCETCGEPFFFFTVSISGPLLQNMVKTIQQARGSAEQFDLSDVLLAIHAALKSESGLIA